MESDLKPLNLSPEPLFFLLNNKPQRDRGRRVRGVQTALRGFRWDAEGIPGVDERASKQTREGGGEKVH